MSGCENFYEQLGVPFEPPAQDRAVYLTWKTAGHTPSFAKAMLLCWFDTTYGEWDGTRYDVTAGRYAMRAFLTDSPYATFEAILRVPNLEEPHDRNRDDRKP